LWGGALAMEQELQTEVNSDTETPIELELQDEIPAESVEPVAQIPRDVRVYDWRWNQNPVSIVYEVMGAGLPVLLLPALSTISTREEMRPLAEKLAAKYQVYLLDWVGFGESDRPRVKYEPKMFRMMLRSFVEETFDEPIVVMAAGHGAGYVMEMVTDDPKPWSWVVLFAPTWRGPLPSMMGDGKRKWFSLIHGLVRSPILGQFLYALNTTRFFLKFMMKRHVYANKSNMTKEVVRSKWQATQGKGKRFASAAFVTGALDPVRSSEAWLSYFQPIRVPVLMVIGEQMPPKSRGEDEVVAHFSGVQVIRTPGSLSLHEEYTEEVFTEIAPFLEKYLSKKPEKHRKVFYE
jgi:pimeloyl-ACP methyl ester carboxylesterase